MRWQIIINKKILSEVVLTESLICDLRNFGAGVYFALKPCLKFLFPSPRNTLPHTHTSGLRERGRPHSVEQPHTNSVEVRFLFTSLLAIRHLGMSSSAKVVCTDLKQAFIIKESMISPSN